MARYFRPGIVFGDNGDNTLTGTSKRDIMFGFNGADVIDGRAGPDIVFAGRGDDTIIAGAGDRIFGGFGFDRVVYSGSVEDAMISGLNGRGKATVKTDEGASRVYSSEELYFEADDYTVNLRGGNNAVLARDDSAGVSENGSVLLTDLTDNDFDFDGDALRITSIDTSGLSGSAVLNADGSISYAANGAFDSLAGGETATTELTYNVTDDNGSTDTATVTITVTGENDAPTLDLPVSVSIDENTTEVLTALGADIDAGDVLSYAISGDDAARFVIDPVSGLLSFAGAPDFEAPADADQDNNYQVTVTVTDMLGAQASGDVTVSVADVAEGPPPDAFINEFHYDNAGSDTGEFIEVAAPVGTDLTGWSLVLYNGNGGSSYKTLSLPTGPVTGTGETGYVSVDAPGLQNGSPDGIALVRPDGNVVEFLSYEGTFTAIDGPAAGLTSTDIGVAETGASDVGLSLQRQEDGTWSGPETATRDAANGDTAPPAQQVKIHDVQGSGDASPLIGLNVGVTGVVTAVMSNGYYMQEEDADADADPTTSEGIFIFTGAAPTVTITDVVYVEGSVSEFFDFTQITAATESIIGLGILPTAGEITLPLTGAGSLEALEGMRVTVTTDGSAPLTIIENFNFDRFGELTVSAGSQVQPTQIYDAQTEATLVAELQALNMASRIVIDDGAGGSNPSTFGYIANTGPGDDGDGILGSGDTYTADGPTLRLGSEITAPIEGVLNFSFGEYKVIPIEVLKIDPATNEGTRDGTAPEVGGDLTVVSFNALNYFTTLGERGASSPADLNRQTEKLVNALVELDGDIVGLQEVENNGFGPASATAALVDALNTRLGSEVYAYVDPTEDGGPIGTDAISNAIIYKLASVEELDSDFLVFEDGGQQRNRPTIAASFEDENGEVLTVAVNHFKSKGPSGLDAGDPTNPNSDSGDGQGFWNQVRTDAAQQLADWLATDPLLTGDPDVLILGDLNAYSQEDPIQALETAGYDNLLEDFIGAADAFSFVFDGQQGALDHALSSSTLTGQITGVDEWHINAQEPDLLSYNSRFNDPGFYNGGDVFASSDHDPLVIGLDLGPDPLVLT